VGKAAHEMRHRTSAGPTPGECSANRCQRLFPASDFFDDCIRVSGPEEGLRVVVGFGEISVDGGLEINDALEHASLEPLLAPFGEEPFDGIEPGR
jgi:hypothetical protein